MASWLRTRRFSEPTFRPSGATNHWKNIVFRDFPTFSRICVFFLLTFSLLTLLTSAFQLSILSEVSLLNFLRIAYIHIYTYTYIYQHTRISSKHVPIRPIPKSWPAWPDSVVGSSAPEILLSTVEFHGWGWVFSLGSWRVWRCLEVQTSLDFPAIFFDCEATKIGSLNSCLLSLFFFLKLCS